jgi:hypothetical protein
MAKRPSLLEEVKAGLSARRGFASWYESLSGEMRSELDGIKAEWVGGALVTTKTTLARRLSVVLKARGVDIGMQGVLRWLEKA